VFGSPLGSSGLQAGFAGFRSVFDNDRMGKEMTNFPKALENPVELKTQCFQGLLGLLWSRLGIENSMFIRLFWLYVPCQERMDR